MRTLTYLFDPLCGWCYGAGERLSSTLAASDVQLELLPTGLFSGQGARAMDDAFAAYAWANDQRIARLTGQVFSDRYREQVLGDRAQPFDSGAATVALTAVGLDAPQRVFEALKAIQHARYVDGQDVTRMDTLIGLFARIGLTRAASALAEVDPPLLQATRSRVERGQALLARVGAQGVPTFVLEEDGRSRLLHAGAIFSNPQAFAAELGRHAA